MSILKVNHTVSSIKIKGIIYTDLKVKSTIIPGGLSIWQPLPYLEDFDVQSVCNEDGDSISIKDFNKILESLDSEEEQILFDDIQVDAFNSMDDSSEEDLDDHLSDIEARMQNKELGF